VALSHEPLCTQPNKKSELTMKKPDLAPPAHLKTGGKKLWQEVTAKYELEAHHLRLLESACGCWDRVTEARAALRKDGAFVPDRFGQLKEHPAAKAERDNKILLMRLVRELGLDLTTDEAPRARRY